jgi:predicted dinucleotide-binding enzyme
LSSSQIINTIAILGSGTMGSGIAQVWALTQSVYLAFFEEPRYRPHPIQRRMVDANCWAARRAAASTTTARSQRAQ